MDSVLQAGVVSAPLQVLIDQFAALSVREVGLIHGADEEFWKLRRTLERIRAMVRRVEENRSFFSTTSSSEAWKMWLEDVESLSYSADDLVDGIMLDFAKRVDSLPAAYAVDRDREVRDTILRSFKLTLPHQVSSIWKKLEDIAREMDALYKTEFTEFGSSGVVSKRGLLAYHGYSSARSSLVDEGSVIGRETEKNEIVDMLLNENLSGSNVSVSVVSVIGMGGIGKTTLTQLVYNDDMLVDLGKFEKKMWVSVSLDFDTIRITKSIIESASGKRCKLTDLDPVQVELQNLIRGKKFLLVLDDYWSEEHKDWDILSSPLRVGARGSKILVTTRSRIVARIVGTARLHHVKSLTDENSWEVVRQRAASNRLLTWELEQIGREVARKCRGLPLAAKALGGMLQFKDDPREWIYVLNSELWDLQGDGNDIFPALALSYCHLPVSLKKCFAYCAIFQKNYDFEMDELVSLWIAEGFVYPAKNMRVEDLGNEYFKNLHWRSFFQFSSVNVRGQKMYKMHDVIHSMAQLISARTCLHLNDSQPNEDHTFFKNTRHISLDCPNRQPRVLEGYLWYENLRTLKVISEYVGSIEIPYELFLRLKFLRVLDLSRLGLVQLPESVEHLKHLRYLNLSENDFIKLPESLTSLFTLQILKLEKCDYLRDLPTNMKDLVSLQHLHMDIKQLNNMPSEFGRLVHLQSLSAFIVGRKNEGNGIGELKNMKFLRGSLCIKNLENVSDVNEAKDAMLHTKSFLDRLELEWSDFGAQNHAELVLSSLQPHENLKELVITNYGGVFLPSWFVSPHCKLSSISLHSCKDHHVLTSLAKIKTLKSLTVEDLSSWNQVDDDFSGFPLLESLVIKNNSNLTSWSVFRGSRFPRLLTLHIEGCPMLNHLPSLVDTGYLRSLNIDGCPRLQSLPIDGLPRSLEEVVISNSDFLTNRCRVQQGADWEKIRSIRRIEIDYVEIPLDMRVL